MVKDVLMVVDVLLAASAVAYFFSAGYLMMHKHIHSRQPSSAPMVNNIWRWTKWPALVSILCDIPMIIFVYEKQPDMWDWLLLLFHLGFWYVYRNMGDDDPMNKLKDKITEKVKELNGRLVLVPASA